MAFTLERLYAICQPDVHLTFAAYRTLDGVRGSIAHQADRAFAAASEPARAALPRVFRELVSVSPEGTATRRRAPLEVVTRTAAAAQLVRTLVAARLLVAEQDGRVEVAHEKLFVAWGRLADWVGENAVDLRLLEKVQLEAADWDQDGRANKHLWNHEKLEDVYAVLARLGMDRTDLDEISLAFIRSEVERLLSELSGPETSHDRRARIGERLAEIGDPRPGVGLSEDGTPDIDWVAIPGGEIELQGRVGKARVVPFHMSRYLVTNAQFQAFVDAEDGYGTADWWKDMPPDLNDGPKKPRWTEPNCPRETVSWYEAVAFCRWLSRRLDFEVRLPTEYEWHHAATGGDPNNVYPWGTEWDARRCNTRESGLNRTTAVGLYPPGASAQGVLDFSGNLWEWCLSKYNTPADTVIDHSGESRVSRGGSWSYGRVYARADARYHFHPITRNVNSGFRVVCAAPIH